ncbi:DNA polymerase alpha-associated DNA helicase A like protein [Verticillium longisporum]|nr:DNA polymerase alpha-associated DNA helicase A like protein [Verticillium longisporum]
MTAGPGFGKTTGASIVALAMQSSLGKILVSAPSNIAVGNFAERIDRITVSVAARYNKEKPADNLTRARHRLVVRGFRFRTELAAFKYLLKNPSGGEVAAAGNSKWRLHFAVMTKDSADADGNLFNRLALDGGISALGFIQASGVPVFRLKCQLRMGKGLFDIIANEIYPDVPFTYGASCDISLPGFSSGRLLEKYIHERFPKVSAPVEGTFSPIFINCPGSRVFTDPRSGSRKCPDQIKVALDFAVDLIKTNHGKAEDIVVLSPYAANVEAIGHMRKKRPEYTAALINMPESSTIDGYQGRENDIVIVVMGTSKSTGPLFTSNENRLNVMFTRQRCGLVVVGELDAVATPISSRTPTGQQPVFVLPTPDSLPVPPASLNRRTTRKRAAAPREVADSDDDEKEALSPTPNVGHIPFHSATPGSPHRKRPCPPSVDECVYALPNVHTLPVPLPLYCFLAFTDVFRKPRSEKDCVHSALIVSLGYKTNKLDSYQDTTGVHTSRILSKASFLPVAMRTEPSVTEKSLPALPSRAKQQHKEDDRSRRMRDLHKLWKRPPVTFASSEPAEEILSLEEDPPQKAQLLRRDNETLRQEVAMLRAAQRTDKNRIEDLVQELDRARHDNAEQSRRIARVISAVNKAFSEYKKWMRKSLEMESAEISSLSSGDSQGMIPIGRSAFSDDDDDSLYSSCI